MWVKKDARRRKFLDRLKESNTFLRMATEDSKLIKPLKSDLRTAFLCCLCPHSTLRVFQGNIKSTPRTWICFHSQFHWSLYGRWCWCHGVLMAGKDWRQKEKRVTEDEMVGWNHRFKGHELGQTPGGGEGQGSLACCSLWGHDMTLWLNNNNKDSCIQLSCWLIPVVFLWGPHN